MYPVVVSSIVGCQVTPSSNQNQLSRLFEVDASSSLAHTFAAAPGGSCHEAELGEVLTYLKKSQYLSLPAEWQNVV